MEGASLAEGCNAEQGRTKNEGEDDIKTEEGKWGGHCPER